MWQGAGFRFVWLKKYGMLRLLLWSVMDKALSRWFWPFSFPNICNHILQSQNDKHRLICVFISLCLRPIRCCEVSAASWFGLCCIGIFLRSISIYRMGLKRLQGLLLPTWGHAMVEQEIQKELAFVAKYSLVMNWHAKFFQFTTSLYLFSCLTSWNFFSCGVTTERIYGSKRGWQWRQ